MNSDRPAPAESTLVRALGVPALAASTVNNVIGSGIFALPAVIAAILGPEAIVAYVVCTAAIGLVALCFAESGSRVSRTGGTYAYVETAFGPYVGFLGGLLFWFGAQATSSAAVASLLVDSLGAVAPSLAGPSVRAALLVAVYGSLATVNILGVRAGARLIEIVTAAKVAPLIVLIVAGLFAGHASNLAWPHMPALGDVGRASLVLIFAFMGIETALTPSAEIKNPARTIPRGLLLGLVAVAVLYAALQLATQGLLGADLARHPAAPLATAAERALGSSGRTLMLVAATVSTFGYVAGDMLATPRVLFAFARDGFLPSRIAAVHPRFRTPSIAIAVHAVIAGGMALTGTFRTLAVLAVVSLLLVYLACCVATLELRRRDVHGDSPAFRTPGGPVIPVLACAVMVWLLSNATRTEFAAVAVVLGVGSVLYVIRRGRVPAAVGESM